MRTIKLLPSLTLILVPFLMIDGVYAELVVPTERVRNGVSIREGQSSDTRFLGLLRPGESLEFIRNAGRWREVRRSPTETAFVSASFTRVISDDPNPPDDPLPDREDDELRIHYLPIGAGTCTVVECPGVAAPPMIIDCGSFSSATRGPGDLDEDAAEAVVDAILAEHDVDPNLVVSHGDTDHINYLDSIFDNVTAAHIWQGGFPDDYVQSFKDLLVAQDGSGADLHQNLATHFHNDQSPIDSHLSCGTASVHILTVNSGSPKNARSLVLSIDYNDFSAVFTGDAEASTERQAIENFDGAVKTTVLSGSHHGADTHGSNGSSKGVSAANISGWPAASSPEVMVYSHGKDHGHPRCSIVSNYHPSLARVPSHPFHCGDDQDDNEPAPRNSVFAEYSTEVSGAITITTDGTSPLSIHCGGPIGCATDIEF